MVIITLSIAVRVVRQVFGIFNRFIHSIGENIVELKSIPDQLQRIILGPVICILISSVLFHPGYGICRMCCRLCVANNIGGLTICQENDIIIFFRFVTLRIFLGRDNVVCILQRFLPVCAAGIAGFVDRFHQIALICPQHPAMLGVSPALGIGTMIGEANHSDFDLIRDFRCVIGQKTTDHIVQRHLFGVEAGRFASDVQSAICRIRCIIVSVPICEVYIAPA